MWRPMALRTTPTATLATPTPHAFATAMEQLAKRISDAVDAIAAQNDTNLGPQKYGDVEHPLDYDESQVKARSKSGAVILFDLASAPIVNGIKVAPLTAARYDVVSALLNSDRRLNARDLDRKSKHEDARKLLESLREIPDWSDVILMSGSERKGYGIK